MMPARERERLGEALTRTLSLAACLTVSWLVGCGGRTPLELGGAAGGEDLCSSAVSGPKPMVRNCSTRDGRARMSAPAAPHVTWTAKLAVDSTGQVGPSNIATDASGHAYVVTTGEDDESVAALTRVRAADGVFEWQKPISPDTETGTPIVLSSGGIDLFGYDKGSSDAVITFDPASGASSSTNFGFSLYYAPRDLAVGADGSLYVTHEDNVGEANTKTYVSRVGPDGAVRWTSVDLATLGPPPMFDGEVTPSILALGRDDLVVIITGVVTQSGGVSVVSAFDPATGAVRWVDSVPGQLTGGPAVRADGKIVVLVLAGSASDLVVIDPETGTPVTTPLATGTFGLSAITEGGEILAGLATSSGIPSLIALGSDGATLWTLPGAWDATVASDGTIVVFGPEVAALDPVTGTKKWELTPPAAGKCLVDGALTSDGGIVALQCDGTLFGASD